MTPYKVYDTWVDLDAVIAIGECLVHTADGGPLARGRFHSAFQNQPIEIGLPLAWLPKKSPKGYDRYSIKEAEAIWNAFVEAWKSRATKTS